MIDPQALLDDLRRLLRDVEADILDQARTTPRIDDDLRSEHARAQRVGRTATLFEPWRDEQVTQAAVAWLLSCTFVRFVEDNGLVAERFLAGPGDGLRLARDTQTAYFLEQPHDTDREYLLHAFETVAAYPGMGDLFDRRHNWLFRLPVSGDQASALLAFWRRQRDDAATGDGETAPLVHDFQHTDLDTRFLGDLYQDLSEDAKKRFALLQTPEFVEEFILDRTLDPAVETFGLADTHVIDPTCGSGHFLLGAFHRLLDRRMRAEPGTSLPVLVQRTLDQIAGVDVNSFAVAIARFRLLIAAVKASEAKTLRDSNDFSSHIATGDALLRDPQPTLPGLEDEGLARHSYRAEDAELLDEILGRTYEVVVGNPPYITVKDKAENDNYRKRYPNVCHRQYALSVPFVRRFFELARDDRDGPAGYVGQITSNSFMKREMGKKLVEDYLPTRDLTTVVDTSGAFIPGHGTPTVILFARNRPPTDAMVRMVLGIRGEPSRPEIPSKGVVWEAIVSQVDQIGSESPWISVNAIPREQLRRHPWSIGGGGAAQLKEALDRAAKTLGSTIDHIGYTGQTNADDTMLAARATHQRARVPLDLTRQFVTGVAVRDWAIGESDFSWFPYRDDYLVSIDEQPAALVRLWSYRTTMWTRATFSKLTYRQEGRAWWEWHQVALHRLRNPLSISYAFVATHNNFVLDRGGKVFNRHAPVIKLPEGASEEQHLRLLGLLNSSVACFWMKQVFHSKGAQGVNEGVKAEAWERFFEFDSTKLQQFPIVDGEVTGLAGFLDGLATEAARFTPAAVCERETPTRAGLDAARRAWEGVRARQVAAQEELDWRCLHLYGITDEDLSLPQEQWPAEGLGLGERAFEVVLGQRIDAEKEHSLWFERHRSTKISEVPAHWPEAYRRAVERRIELIRNDRDVGLVERPEHKRRWATEPWEKQEQAALRSWLLDRLEDRDLWYSGDQPRIQSSAQLTDRLRADADFMEVLALYAGPSADPAVEVQKLVLSDAVPAVAAARYKGKGLEKRRLWEETWDLQRREDAGETVEIAVPPKYTSADFRSHVYWQARGKLDVPKERFVLYPEAGRAIDPSPVLGWAGWDHKDQVVAVASYTLDRRQVDGWDADQLRPLLAAWQEVLPWVRQWHNDPDPRTGRRLGDFFAEHLATLCRELGLTGDDLRAWAPESGRGRGRGRSGARRKSAPDTADDAEPSTLPLPGADQP